MDELPYALSEEDFVRMSNAVRRVEGLPPRRDSQAFNRAAVEENPHAWIKITSATGSTVTLGGGTVTGYAAVWGYFDSGGTGFIWTTNVAWFVPSPGSGTPLVNATFQCRLLGADTSGVPIWGASLPAVPDLEWVLPSSNTLSTITLTGGTTQGYAANILTYSASNGLFTSGASVWFLPINGEIPSLTTNKRFQCRLLGADASGKQMFGSALEKFSSSTATLSSTVTPTTNGAFADVLTLALTPGIYMLFASASGIADTGTTDNQIQGWMRLFDGADLTGNYYIAALTGTASGTDFTNRGTASIQIPYTTTSSPTIHLQAQSSSAIGTAVLNVTSAKLTALRLD